MKEPRRHWLAVALRLPPDMLMLPTEPAFCPCPACGHELIDYPLDVPTQEAAATVTCRCGQRVAAEWSR